MTYRSWLELLIWLSNVAVLIGEGLEYWEVKRGTEIEPGKMTPPDFGTKLWGSWIDPIFPTRDKKLAAWGWAILTTGLAVEVLLTPFLLKEQYRDEQQAKELLLRQESKIQQVETEIKDLMSGVTTR